MAKEEMVMVELTMEEWLKIKDKAERFDKLSKLVATEMEKSSNETDLAIIGANVVAFLGYYG